MRRVIGRWLGGIAALLAFGQAGQAATPASAAPSRSTNAAEPAPRPAIWLLEDEDTRIYLFGTTHVFAAGLRWRSARLDAVIAEADELVMETPEAAIGDLDAPETGIAPMAMGKSVPILERVSAAARPRLQAALEATGMPMEFFDSLHTWAVAFLITGFQIVQATGGGEAGETNSTWADGVPALSGAEEELGALFRSRKRPISGVETMEEQLGIFANMPQGTQRRFLEMTVAEGSGAASSGDVTARAWVLGDVEAIAAEMATMPPELYDVLLTRRNGAWTEWLMRRLERPGTVLFAVGSGHLAGQHSVQRMLAARGLEARRID